MGSLLCNILIWLLVLLQVTPVRAETGDTVLLIVMCAAMGVWILFVAFVFNRILAIGVFRLVRWYLGKDAQVWIDGKSLGISLFTGTISFYDLRVVAPGWMVQAVNGSIRFRYWADAHHDQARVAITLNGVVIRLLNNKSAYMPEVPGPGPEHDPSQAGWISALLPVKIDFIGGHIVVEVSACWLLLSCFLHIV